MLKFFKIISSFGSHTKHRYLRKILNKSQRIPIISYRFILKIYFFFNDVQQYNKKVMFGKINGKRLEDDLSKIGRTWLNQTTKMCTRTR